MAIPRIAVLARKVFNVGAELDEIKKNDCFNAIPRQLQKEYDEAKENFQNVATKIISLSK